MVVKVDVSIDLSKLPPRLKTMNKFGQFALINQVMADTNNYVPALRYDLRNSVAVALDGKSISYNRPYARKQYYNYGAKFTTPGSGPKWDSKALAIHRGSWIRVTKKAMR